MIHFGCISTTPRPRLLACVTAMLGVARSSVHLASIRRRPLRAVRGRHASAGVYGRGLALRPKGPARFSPRAAAGPFAMPTGTLAPFMGGRGVGWRCRGTRFDHTPDPIRDGWSRNLPPQE